MDEHKQIYPASRPSHRAGHPAKIPEGAFSSWRVGAEVVIVEAGNRFHSQTGIVVRTSRCGEPIHSVRLPGKLGEVSGYWWQFEPAPDPVSDLAQDSTPHR